MDNTLTPWFPAGVQPARPGVYETRWAPGQADWQAKFPQYQHWDGETWGGWGMDTEIAQSNAASRSIRQHPEWRGLNGKDTMLDELQRKAEAARSACPTKPWFTKESLLADNAFIDLLEDAAFIASASPDVVLRLIAVARAAHDYCHNWHADSAVLLRESLAALQAVGKKEGMDKQ